MRFHRSLLMPLLIASFPAIAESLTSKAETQEICNQIAASTGSGQYEKAWDSIGKYTDLPQDEMNASYFQMKSQMESLYPRYGKIIDSEYVGVSKLGESYYEYIYLLKFERSFLMMKCGWYRPKDIWVMQGVQWSDEIEFLPTEN